jgi:hypothetical protein
MPVTVKHKVLFFREGKAGAFRPVATRDAADPNADEDFQALRLQKIVDANRSGAERPEFGVGVQTATDAQDGTQTSVAFADFGPAGPIKKDGK